MGRLCKRPGCRGIIIGGTCNVCRHTEQRFDNRASAQERGYDSRWARFAQLYKQRYPLCALCELEGRTTWADVVHHLEPLQSGGEVFPGDDGLVSVCNRCHQRVEKLGKDWKRAAKR